MGRYKPTYGWFILVYCFTTIKIHNSAHKIHNVGPPSYVCWFINPMKTIVIGTINHSYWRPHIAGGSLHPNRTTLPPSPQLWAIVPWPRDDNHFGLSYLGHHGRTVLATLHQLREGTQHHLAARARRAAKGGRNGRRNVAKWPVKWMKTCEHPDSIAISSCKSTGTKWITGYRA